MNVKLDMNTLNCVLLIVVLVLVVMCCCKSSKEDFKAECTKTNKTGKIRRWGMPTVCKSYRCRADTNPRSTKWEKCDEASSFSIPGSTVPQWCTKRTQKLARDRKSREDECAKVFQGFYGSSS